MAARFVVTIMRVDVGLELGVQKFSGGNPRSEQFSGVLLGTLIRDLSFIRLGGNARVFAVM